MTTTTPAGRTGRLAWLRHHPAPLTLLAYGGLAVGLCFATWAHPLTSHVGVRGDPDAYFWTMRWGPFALSHLHNPFFTTYLIAPRGANLMWNAPPLPGLIMWPLTALAGVVLSYNVLATLSVAVSAWCMYLALRRLVGGQLGPFVGGLFYGFSPFMVEQLTGHVVLTLAMVPPLMLLVLHEALVRQRWRWWGTGFALGALASVQLMTFQEMLGSEAVAAAIGTTCLALVARHHVRSHLPHALRCLAATLVAFLAISAPALRTMFFGAQRLTQGSVHPPNIFVNDLWSFVLPTDAQLLVWDEARRTVATFTGNGSEWNAYLGVPLILLLVAAVIRLRSHAPLVRMSTLSALLIAVLSLGPSLRIAGQDQHLLMPGRVLGHLPLVAHLLPSRLSLMMDLFVAVVIAAVIDASWRRPQVSLRAAGMVAVGLALLPLIPRVPVVDAPVTVPPFFTGPGVQRIPEGSVALVAPYVGSDVGLDPSPEVWQAESGFRFRKQDGYVFVPTDGGVANGAQLSVTTTAMVQIAGGAPRPVMTPALRATMRADLAAVDVRTILVGPMPHEDEMYRFIVDLTGREGEPIDGVFVWPDITR